MTPILQFFVYHINVLSVKFLFFVIEKHGGYWYLPFTGNTDQCTASDSSDKFKSLAKIDHKINFEHN
jgi:hypothetical protein